MQHRTANRLALLVGLIVLLVAAGFAWRVNCDNAGGLPSQQSAAELDRLRRVHLVGGDVVEPMRPPVGIDKFEQEGKGKVLSYPAPPRLRASA